MQYVKAAVSHSRATEVEAAGLQWLKTAQKVGGPRVVEVLEAQPTSLSLESVACTTPDAVAAEEFGAALAQMHRSLWPAEPLAEEVQDNAGARVLFGQLPPEHPAGVPLLFGPADQLLTMGSGAHHSWGAFQAAERLRPVLQKLRGVAADSEWDLLFRAQERIASGDFDGPEPPSMIHGDLWSGNVLWSSGGAVLIDPAAHAGHRESDMAMLELFGLPHLDRVLSSYQAQAPLTAGWQDRMPVHQLFYLAVHWLLFGSTYRGATLSAAEQTLALPS